MSQTTATQAWTQACEDNDLAALKRICDYSTIYRKQPKTCHFGFLIAAENGYLSIVRYILEQSELQLRDIVDPVVFARRLIDGHVAWLVSKYILSSRAILSSLTPDEVMAIIHLSIDARNLDLIRALVLRAPPLAKLDQEACIHHCIREYWDPGFELLFELWGLDWSMMTKFIDYAESIKRFSFRSKYSESIRVELADVKVELDGKEQVQPESDTKRNVHSELDPAAKPESDTKRYVHSELDPADKHEPRKADVKPEVEVIRWHPKLNTIIKSAGISTETLTAIYPAMVQDAEYKTLYRACQLGKLEVVQFLVRECKLSPGPECLEVACAGGHSKLVNWLLELRPEVKASALLRACQAGFLDVVQVLIEQDKMLPNAECLKAAIIGGHLELADWLVHKAGVKPSPEYLELIHRIKGS